MTDLENLPSAENFLRSLGIPENRLRLLWSRTSKDSWTQRPASKAEGL